MGIVRGTRAFERLPERNVETQVRGNSTGLDNGIAGTNEKILPTTPPSRALDQRGLGLDGSLE